MSRYHSRRRSSPEAGIGIHQHEYAPGKGLISITLRNLRIAVVACLSRSDRYVVRREGTYELLEDRNMSASVSTQVDNQYIPVARRAQSTPYQALFDRKTGHAQDEHVQTRVGRNRPERSVPAG